MAWDRLVKYKGAGGLGFKRIHDFNLALLGKQCWRLLTRPSSIVARVIKARYFPSSSLWTTSLGHNPSYVWRSIWESWSLVQQGIVWQVGSGSDIFVWHSPWLYDPHDSFISTLPLEPYVQQILSIPLGRSWVSDCISWKLERDGEFSVKSTYKLQCSYASPSTSILGLWSKFWKCKVPPKVLNFVWRALSNVVPCYDVL
ncbi:hypothetical protein MANES_10G114416v8 [Manihot esculenta]|uniref:Uncharacterized protein n=1 Tax=Manihot esculenta TaxID=3983 RepID=A0ACB7H0V1_MANES|nr:hypothetical protein MANES_10G114416v8 [Manihot esculenta]